MFSYFKFPNGPEVISASIFGTKAVTILALFPVGSRYEKQEENGISHFIEHMTFKGTKSRPTNLEIARDLNSLGAEFNAYTSKDHTGWWIKVEAGKLEKALEVLQDILFHPLFNPKEVEKEKGVILEEIKMYEDNPLLYIDHFFENTLYGEHPLGRMVIGTEKNIRKINRKELLLFRKKFYIPSRLLLVFAGQVKKEEIFSLAKKYFSQFRSSFSDKINFRKFIPKKIKPKINILTREIKQVHFALGFPSYAYFHPKLEALELLSIILGGNMSSRLFSEIRVKRGLAYYIKSDLNCYQDTGNFAIFAGVDKETLREALRVISQELEKIKKFGPKDEEIKRAKDYYQGIFYLNLEDSESLADWYGKIRLLTRKILTPEEKIAKIKKVSCQDIISVSREILQRKKINLALIGPLEKFQLSFKDF